MQYLWVTTYYARATEGWRGYAPYLGKTLLAGLAIWTLPVVLIAASLAGARAEGGDFAYWMRFAGLQVVLGPLVGGTIYDLFGLMPIFYFAGAAGLAGSALFAILVEKKSAS